jgi:hypothetical protein
VEGGCVAFPVDPNGFFLNQVGKMERLSACWTRFNKTTGLVSVQHECTVTVEYRACMESYPFDRVIIPLHLAIRQENYPKDKAKKRTWRLPDAHIAGSVEYSEDRSPINADPSRISYLNQRNPRMGHNPVGPLKRPVPCLVFDRNPAYFLSSVALPLFLIVLGCLLVLILDSSDPYTRYNTMIMGMLTVSAYKSAIQGRLPVTSVTTFADWYILACFVLLLLALAAIIIIDHVQLDNTSTEVVVLSSCLLAVWIVPNLILLSDLCWARNPISRCCFQVEPWDKVFQRSMSKPPARLGMATS